MLFSTTRRLYRALGLLLVLMLVAACFSAVAEEPAEPAPAGAEEPASACAMLDIGTVVNTKMKALAGGNGLQYWNKTEHIRAILMADELPAGFVPSADNTVSAEDSAYPVYIFFDNKDDAGIMYFYAEGGRITLNPNSSMLFANNLALMDISGVSGWDASQAVYMYGLFMCTTGLADVQATRNWDTSGARDMSYMFFRDTNLQFVDVSNWNTSNVVTMEAMFAVGDNWKANGQLREIVGIENMDVSHVVDMTCMFYGAGHMMYYDIGGWDVSNVVSMNHMFCDNRELRVLDLSKWDVSSVKTMYSMFDDNVMLTTIGDVSHWNTSSLIDAGGWLNGCHAFVGDDTGTLDLSGWDTSKLQCAGEMFYYTSIRTIDISGWTFDAITNDRWEGAGAGFYYETGNDSEEFRGLGGMFKDASPLRKVYMTQETMDSYNAAVERGVNTTNMWRYTKAQGFTVR